ncbi:MAG: amidohydrolase family protein, partial [Bifidobacteriaceae bacterium]|nr:amidohydrolase family protein [Bifidobacteriaceae bacterium]
MTNQAGGIGRATTWAVRGAALLPVDSPAGQAASEGRGRLRAEPGGTAAPPQGGPAAGPLRLAPDAAVGVRGSRIVRAGDHAHLSEVEAAAARGGQGDPAVAAALAQARRWDGYILPGLVDLHCHGGGGQSFPDAASAEEALVAVQEHRRHGTTSLVASLVTDAPAVLVRQSALLAELCQAGHLAGIHLEGPFLSPRRAGAQDPALMQTPSPDLVRQVAAAARGWFKVMTVAPELPGVAAPAPCGAEAVADAAPAAAGAGSGSLISALAEVGAVPSFGHTDCSAEQMGAAATAARRALAGAGAPAEFAEAGPGQTGAAAAAAPGRAAPPRPGAAPAGRPPGAGGGAGPPRV